MNQPLFSCTKCFKNFPHSEMSRSKQACKNCNPTNSSFKQCNYCKSDFRHYISGSTCPRCQSMKEKFGEPKSCTICTLMMAFGNALVCQRCLHYRTKFGDPVLCQTCSKSCAYIKDQESREKVDGKILCWVCTYNYKSERKKDVISSNNDSKKKTTEYSSTSVSFKKSHHHDDFRRHRRDHHKSLDSSATADGSGNNNMDSVYNDQLLKIASLQDEISQLQSQLDFKRMELIKKDNIIGELKSDVIESNRNASMKLEQFQQMASQKQESMLSTIKQLEKENFELKQSLKKRKVQSSGLGKAPSSSFVDMLKPLKRDAQTVSTVNLTSFTDKQHEDEGLKKMEPAAVADEEENPHPEIKRARFILESSDEDEEETAKPVERPDSPPRVQEEPEIFENPVESSGNSILEEKTLQIDLV